MTEENNIPADFVWKNLTQYQKETIILKYKIFNQFYKYHIEKKMRIMNTCQKISEEINKEIDTVFRLNKQIQKSMK